MSADVIAFLILIAWAVVMLHWVRPREQRASDAFERLLALVADAMNPKGKAGLQ